ncbi:hypothetical protein GCM10009736_29010 [Actinomadura bangladeshensis]
MLGAVTAPATAVAATARPAVPSLTPRSPAIVGSTLAGRNSLPTRTAIPAASATIGDQFVESPDRAGDSGFGESVDGGEDWGVDMPSSLASSAPPQLIA